MRMIGWMCGVKVGVRRNTAPAAPAHIRKIPLLCRLGLVLRLGSVVSS